MDTNNVNAIPKTWQSMDRRQSKEKKREQRGKQQALYKS